VSTNRLFVYSRKFAGKLCNAALSVLEYLLGVFEDYNVFDVYFVGIGGAKGQFHAKSIARYSVAFSLVERTQGYQS
jgi:hypothetical protein